MFRMQVVRERKLIRPPARFSIQLSSRISGAVMAASKRNILRAQQFPRTWMGNY